MAEHHPASNRADELNKAAGEGNVDRVRQLLGEGVDPNGVNENGYPAMQAMNTCCPEIAQILLERGGDPNVRDGVGRTPLHNAVDLGTPEMILTLLVGGADCSIQDTLNEESPVHLAARQGKKEIVAVFQQFSTFAERDKNGKTPHDLAMENGHAEVADMIDSYRYQGLNEIEALADSADPGY